MGFVDRLQINFKTAPVGVPQPGRFLLVNQITLFNLHSLPLNTQLKASRTATRSKPRAKVPNQFWGTDMTKVYISSWGWVYLHVVLGI
jgi:hypothetical protein